MFRNVLERFDVPTEGGKKDTKKCVSLFKYVLGSDSSSLPVFQFLFLSEVLQWRAQTTPDHVLYTLLSSRVTAVHASQLGHS